MNSTQKLFAPALAVLTIGGCITGCAPDTARGAGPASTASTSPASTTSQTASTSQTTKHSAAKNYVVGKVVKTESEWKKILTPEQFDVMRKAGTEAPFTSPLLNVHESGTFRCIACDNELFSSKTKFESGTGWPSFWAPIAENRVRNVTDNSDGMERTEVRCGRCGAHLGHVFNDGPAPTHLRYCMNGVALKFVKGK